MTEVKKVVVEHYRVPDVVGRILSRGGNLRGQPSERQLVRYRRNGANSRGFVPFPQGGRTVVTVVFEDGTELSAEAVCSLADHFSYKRGKQIATGRLSRVTKEEVLYNLGG